MPVLREDSVLIMDGAIKLYRRQRSRKWQAAFQIDGQYIRISTGKSDLDEAKQRRLIAIWNTSFARRMACQLSRSDSQMSLNCASLK